MPDFSPAVNELVRAQRGDRTQVRTELGLFAMGKREQSLVIFLTPSTHYLFIFS
jgi:hypothetical protein